MNLTTAYREYLYAQTIEKTKPILCYNHQSGFFVSWYFSKETILKAGWEVVCG